MSVTFRLNNGLIAHGPGGSQLLTRGAEKAAQDLLYYCLSPYDPVEDMGNELFRPDGSITVFPGGSPFSTAMVASFFRSAIVRLQRAQSRDATTSVTEVIQQILLVNVTPVNGDPTSIDLEVVVRVDGRDIGVSQTIGMEHLLRRAA